MWRFILFALFYSCHAEIPNYIKICKRTDPEIGKCMQDSINNLRHKFATGITELNVPGIEPLYVPSLNLQGNTNLNLSELYVHGPSTFEIKDLSVDIEKSQFAFLFKFENITYNGKYNIDMKILTIPLKSSGKMNGFFKNVQMTGKMHGRKIKTNDKTYLMFKKLELKLYGNESHVELDNLFRGQRELNKAAHDLINTPGGDFGREILPLLENTLAERFTELANRITSHFTYDELFPAN